MFAVQLSHWFMTTETEKKTGKKNHNINAGQNCSVL